MKQITAVMAGVVLEILVKKGDSISEGQDIVILESMKMQLPIQATAAGTVDEIKINSGDFVNEGDTIVLVS
jgi:acetyl-CoA carboxylase biotin carboxyl carrier protein